MMSSTNHSNCTESNRLEMMSRLLSSLGCSWNMNETSDPDEKPTTTSVSTERIPARKVTYPSFSLSNNDQEEAEEKNSYHSESSSQEREAAQSQASKLMSRRYVHSEPKEGDDDRQAQTPQRIMLENILDSFDRLVDARIRAYKRILSNHVRVLTESNNTMGARIAEYKLQTMLEFAANHLLLDSISMEFKTIATKDDGCNDVDDDNLSSSTSTAAVQNANVSLPIVLTVEIRSPRFCQECVGAINFTDDASTPHPTHQGKLTFRAHGEVRGKKFVTPDDLKACKNAVLWSFGNGYAVPMWCSSHVCHALHAHHS